jgi:hypothetical protein
MIQLTRVGVRVLVLGGVAAPHLPADHAHTEVHPRVTEDETLFTALRLPGGIVDLREMRTLARRHWSSKDALQRKTDGGSESHAPSYHAYALATFG